MGAESTASEDTVICMKKVILAFSGGLDTSFAVVYLKKQGYEVVTVTVNTGGFTEQQLEDIKKRAASLGANKHYTVSCENEFFDKIIDIFKKSVEKRGLEGELKTTPTEFKGFTIDLPRKQKDIYHGSSYEILCNRSKTLCKIKGDLVIEEDYDYEATKMLEESDCKVFGVHTHVDKREEEKLPHRESHIHFICQDRDRQDTMRMINFLKDY